MYHLCPVPASRTGEGSELLLDAPMPTPPTPLHQSGTPKSPIMGVMPMQPMPANVMSPDDMLRAYAEHRATGAAANPGAPSLPASAANYSGNGMHDSVYPSSTLNR